MKTIYAAFALLAMGVISGGPSVAAPVGSIVNRPANESLTTSVAVSECRRDERGWHYMRGERRETCRPERPSEGGVRVWGWRCEGPRCGWWHQHEHRWHDPD
jgi:hypothetical protein